MQFPYLRWSHRAAAMTQPVFSGLQEWPVSRLNGADRRSAAALPFGNHGRVAQTPRTATGPRSQQLELEKDVELPRILAIATRCELGRLAVRGRWRIWATRPHFRES